MARKKVEKNPNEQSIDRSNESQQRQPEPVADFVGIPLHEQRLQHTFVPEEFRSHPAIKDKFFYTIPKELIKSICRPQVGESFEVDEDLLRMETVLSEISGDHSSRIGFWNNNPVSCALMRRRDVQSPEYKEIPGVDMSRFGIDVSEANEGLREADKQLNAFARNAGGYAGWLMTNTQFVAELGELNKQFKHEMARWGTEQVGLRPSSLPTTSNSNAKSLDSWTAYETAIIAFCVRWRLQGLAGPRVPVPMRPMMAGQFPLSIVEQLMRAGGVFNWPDTYPIHSRDEMRELLSNALGLFDDEKEHLRGWLKIIAPQSRTKNQINAFHRRFLLQHYWRLLQQRHPLTLKRRIERVDFAFAEFFDADDKSISNDRHVMKVSLESALDE